MYLHLFNKENIQIESSSSLYIYKHPECTILQDRISKEEEREDPRRDTSIFDYKYSYTQFSHPMQGNYSTYRINSSTRIPQEIPQLQGSSHADRYKASSTEWSRNTILVTSTQVHYLNHCTLQYGAHSISSLSREQSSFVCRLW